MCTCAEKDAEIASLKEKVASLEADLVTARECLGKLNEIILPL